MKRTLDNGHASRVPADQLATAKGKAWYLPHFHVYHPRKPDQICVVFDCSAVYENESLHKHLLQGTDQLNSLIGVFTRFRKEAVALTCDIKQQRLFAIPVVCKQRSYRPNRRILDEPSPLRRSIITRRSKLLLTYQTAQAHRQEFGDEASDFLLRDFYVDDGLKSVSTVEQALRLIQCMQAICAKDNLRLHKFASNSKDILEALPVNDRAKDLKDLDLRRDTMPVQRSLGTYWCIESDTIGFRIELRDKPATHHGMLSTISSVYDPLGAVSPVILVGKQILQALCRQNISWDDPIPEDILPLWEKWWTELPLLEKLRFPSSLKPTDFGDPVQTEIHSSQMQATVASVKSHICA